MKRSYKKRVSFGTALGLSVEDAGVLAKLATPEKIQDFITDLPINREKSGDTCLSVTGVLKYRHAHCIEGSFVAAAALWMAGSPPLLMDMQAEGDDDHVIALYRAYGCWGAISKSNHVWLRWRDPVYRSLRELAMSYFHEYTNEDKKTLRTYSASFDLRRFRPEDWITNEESCWEVAGTLDATRHYHLLKPAQRRALKSRDNMEMLANKLKEYRV